MNVPAHTPGPWGVEDPMGPEMLSVIANPQDPTYDWLHIALVSLEGGDDEPPKRQQRANAQLMAAAPEMLEALWQYESDLLHPPTGDSRERRLERVRKVIAKASGRA